MRPLPLTAAWWRGDNKVAKLRKALADACTLCTACNGSGTLAMAGATMRCPRCGYWRRVLEETK